MSSDVQYRIESNQIGSGASSKVRLATNIATGEQVAVKIISKKLKKTEDDQRLMRLEPEFLRRLNHHNIGRLCAVAEDENYVYLFMELVRGGDMCTYLCERQRLKEREAQRYFKQTLDAIEHCHAKGITHRDIKLENLLLDKRTDTVKLIDFGLADFMNTSKEVTPQHPEWNQRIFTKFCGSPSWAAPELCSRVPYLGTPVDVWGLGILLYVLLVGDFPFVGKSGDVRDLFTRIVKEKVTFPAHIAISAEAKDLIQRMLSKDPRERITIADIRRSAFVRKNFDKVSISKDIKPTMPKSLMSKLPRFVSKKKTAPVSHGSNMLLA